MNVFTSLRSLAILIIFLLAARASDVYAAGVVRCDNCAYPQNAAIQSGAGPTYVFDYQNRTVRGYEVEYDRELRRWRAIPHAVPAQVAATFQQVADPAYMATMAKGGTILIGPGSGNTNYSFPPGFRDANAHDIVTNATLRGLLEGEIARMWAGANTGNETWDNLAISLQSVALSIAGSTVGANYVTLVIVWKDGSKTTLKIEAGSTHLARYQQGESRDSNDNRIPDAAATGGGGASFVGDYSFRDTMSLVEWIESARAYGIPVTGAGERIRCTWDGQTLRCQRY